MFFLLKWSGDVRGGGVEGVQCQKLSASFASSSLLQLIQDIKTLADL